MNPAVSKPFSLPQVTQKLNVSRGKTFGLLIIGALFAFEIFNYSTTEFALKDMLGGLSFASVRWATILAIAFCGIDFAGLARLFTPERGGNELKEVWYLFGAWLLAASMNAMLTWWGVALAIVNHESLGGTVIARDTLIKVVPIFVALMVWLIRVLIIGTFSVAGNRLFSQGSSFDHSRPISASQPAHVVARSPQSAPVGFRPIPKTSSETELIPTARPEPTYHPAGMSNMKSNNLQPGQ
jgi:hypothetical protein